MTKKTRPMQYIHQGLHSKEELALYMRLTKIESAAKITALEDFTIKGVSLSVACEQNKVDKSDFRTMRNKLNEVAGVVESLIELRLERGQLSHSIVPSSKEGS